jgi:hypothetical protein
MHLRENVSPIFHQALARHSRGELDHCQVVDSLTHFVDLISQTELTEINVA